jgi:predicted aspartyl protease
MSYIISKNGLRIKTYTLINTGANGYIFIDCRLAKKASQFLDIPIQTLPVSHDIRAFNGKKASLITQYIKMNLHMNGRKQSKQLILLVQLRSHNIILGQT